MESEKKKTEENILLTSQRSEDKIRKVGFSAIFEKDFLQIVGTLASGEIKDSDVQTICSMHLVASTSRRPIELASIASGSINIFRENG